MAKPTIRRVAVIGTGVIGRSWIQVFARAGCAVRVFDPDPDQLAQAVDWFKRDLKQARKHGDIKKKEARARLDRVAVCESLGEALDRVGYVQESGPERLDIKRTMFAELDASAPPDAILGSSTSTMDMTEIARGLPGARRCIVTHPVNPPHVVPAVEVLGGADTDPAVTKATARFLRSVGQVPVLMWRYAKGFVINRMQMALVREAFDLVATGVADVEAVDSAISDGIGLRWAFMGPFATANTNADGGAREYFARYGGAFQDGWADLNTNVKLTDALIEEVGEETDAMLGTDRGAQRAWRDRMLVAIRAVKDQLPLKRPKRKKAHKRPKADEKAKPVRLAKKA